MEQLQKDRNYTRFLVRLIQKEIRNNNIKNKEQLMSFINKIKSDINTKEVIDYVNNNGLTFNYQEFNYAINQLIAEFDKMLEKANNVQLNQNIQSQNTVNEEIKYIPITKVDVNAVPKDLIEKVNFLIVNPNVDVNNVLVDIKYGTFLDISTKKPIVIRRNPENNAFELVEEKKEETPKETEKLNLNKEKPKVKTKKLVMPDIIKNNKAYISTVLVTAVCAISGIIIASLLLVK